MVDFLNTGHLLLAGRGWTPVKELVQQNRLTFEPKHVEIEEALERAHQEHEASADSSDSEDTSETDSFESNVDLNNEARMLMTDENRRAGDLPPVMQEMENTCDREARQLLTQLTSDQRRFHDAVYRWCLSRKQDPDTKPLRAFLTGGAGTGKSALIKCIAYTAKRILRNAQEPDAIVCLTTSTTGVSAVNVYGQTLHNAFQIPPRTTLQYVSMKEERMQKLREAYKDLQLLIIDEISMATETLLQYVSGRLNQVCAF